MKLKFSFLLGLLIFSNTVFAQLALKYVSENIVNSSKIFGSEYFPLNSDSVIIFDSNVGETTSTIEKEENEYVINYESSTMTYRQNIIRNNEGIFITKIENKFLLFGDEITYSEPLLRLPANAQIGDTWFWEGYEINDGDSAKIFVEGKIVSEEEVKTAGGSFLALKTFTKINFDDGSTDELYEWFAPEIGIVKIRAKVGGNGFTGTIQDILGLDELYFSFLKKEE